MSFVDGKKGYILGVCQIRKFLAHIEIVYHVNGLMYNLISVSQMCDIGKKVRLISTSYTITHIETSKVFLIAKRYKDLYVADLGSIYLKIQSVLSVMSADLELWHKRLGHFSTSLLNKLISKDLFSVLSK